MKVETEREAEICAAIKVYEPKFVNDNGVDDYTDYKTCEKAAFDLKFGRDKWKIKFRDVENNYQGSTKLVVVAKSDGGCAVAYLVEYGWGSCSGCDTLDGSGPVAATEMIYEEIKEWT